MRILVIGTTTARSAFIAGDLSKAEQILMQEINIDANNYTSYTNRSLIMARKLDWDGALYYASKSLGVERSWTGFVAKGIALYGKQQVSDAAKAFDLALIYAFAPMRGDPKGAHFISLIKIIAMFNANYRQEAMLLIQGVVSRPNVEPLAARVVEAYLRAQLGTISMDGGLHREAADHFTAAVKSGIFFSKLDIDVIYEEFVVLFGWNLKSLWQIANQQRWRALVRAGQVEVALESYRLMMDMRDEPTKAAFLARIKTLDEQYESHSIPCTKTLPS